MRQQHKDKMKQKCYGARIMTIVSFAAAVGAVGLVVYQQYVFLPLTEERIIHEVVEEAEARRKAETSIQRLIGERQKAREMIQQLDYEKELVGSIRGQIISLEQAMQVERERILGSAAKQQQDLEAVRARVEELDALRARVEELSTAAAAQARQVTQADIRADEHGQRLSRLKAEVNRHARLLVEARQQMDEYRRQISELSAGLKEFRHELDGLAAIQRTSGGNDER